MTDNDIEMINAMAVIKKYCVDIDNIDGCRNCPMFENCDDANKQFPYFWYIPEV